MKSFQIGWPPGFVPQPYTPKRETEAQRKARAHNLMKGKRDANARVKAHKEGAHKEPA